MSTPQNLTFAETHAIGLTTGQDLALEIQLRFNSYIELKRKAEALERDWKEKCMEADTLRRHLSTSESVNNDLIWEARDEAKKLIDRIDWFVAHGDFSGNGREWLAYSVSDAKAFQAKLAAALEGRA